MMLRFVAKANIRRDSCNEQPVEDLTVRARPSLDRWCSLTARVVPLVLITYLSAGGSNWRLPSLKSGCHAQLWIWYFFIIDTFGTRNVQIY